METIAAIMVLLFFLSLLYELICIPVPSVASTYQLLFNKDLSKNDQDGLFRRIQNMNPVLKMLFIIVPFIVAIGIYCLPLGTALFCLFGTSCMFSGIHIIALFVAVILMVVSRAISIHSALGIRKHHKHDTDIEELEEDEMFSFSRNPIVVAMHIGLLGFNILLLNPWYAILSFFFVLYIHAKILIEETYLKQHFGLKYESYLKKVNRYI